MKKEKPKTILQKYPQLEQIFSAIEEFKKTGKQQVKCTSCDSIITVEEDKIQGALETNCSCGKSKFRMRWNSKMA